MKLDREAPLKTDPPLTKSTTFSEQNQLKYFKKLTYPKDPGIVPNPLATLKCSHAKTCWTCAEFFLLNDNLT